MKRTTIRAYERARIEEICLDQPNITDIPNKGDRIRFLGGTAVVKDRTFHPTDGGHLSVILEVQTE